MLTSSLAAVALLLIGQDGVAATKSESAKLQREFMKAMRSSPSARNHQNKQRKRRATSVPFVPSESTVSSEAKLRKKLMEKATFVPPEEVQRRERKEEQKRKLEQQRFLANDGQAGDDANGDRNDGADDYFVAVGQWPNTFGFDITQYSISYLRCAEVRQFDDEIAATEDTDSVFATKHFAIFRFCPAMTCDGYDRDKSDECEDGDEDCCQDGDENCAGNQQGNNQAQNQNKNNGNAYNQARNNYYDRNGNCEGENCCAEGQEGCEQEEEEELTGARGAGCQSNYGEYMLELEDYLAIMMEYRAERLETYCDYCEDCMWKVYKSWLNSQGRRDLRDINDEEWRRELEEAPEDVVRKLGGCPEYQQCKTYNNICGNEYYDELSDYFECTEVQRNNGMVAYVGPHCAQDGETITIGIYADQYCSEYIGNSVDIRNWIGESVDEDSLKEYYQDDEFPCIPCRAADQMFEGSTFQYGDSEENWGEDEVTTLCEAVYKYSARCDKHYRSYSNKAKYAKYYNKEYMDLSCDFIDSIVADNYDEYGFVRLNSSADSEDPLKRNFLTDNIYYEEYGHYMQEVTPIQVFGLCASILACGLLALWSCALHNSLTKKAPWRPRRGLQAASPASNANAAVTRQNSGIVMGRSRSGGSYYMGA